MRLVVVVGNPKPQSRTRAVAELAANRVAEITGASHDPTVDLCDYGDDLFRWPHEELATLNARVAEADVLIVATPTYKASYTGMLKAFLDGYPSGGLTGVTAIPLMTIADAMHTLAVDFMLRPLLVELGASVPTRGLAFLTSQMDRAEQVVDRWLSANESVLRRISRFGDGRG
jgi:FMN reductase